MIRDVDTIAYDIGWVAGWLYLPPIHADAVWLAGWRAGAHAARDEVTDTGDLRREVALVLREVGMLEDPRDRRR